jgi:hypothetical protein
MHRLTLPPRNGRMVVAPHLLCWTNAIAWPAAAVALVGDCCLHYMRLYRSSIHWAMVLLT